MINMKMLRIRCFTFAVMQHLYDFAFITKTFLDFVFVSIDIAFEICISNMAFTYI